jgi:hypothetical protein
MPIARWRQRLLRQRELSRRAAAAMAEGGAFRVEGCLDVANGGRPRVSRRWRFGAVVLQPREVLGLDPRHWPTGTKLVIVPPGWAPPVRPWYSYRETAFMLRRAVVTIRNLVYRHRLERTTYWDARGRYRRRVTDLPPATVRRLAELTGRSHWILPEPRNGPGDPPRGEPDAPPPDPGAGPSGDPLAGGIPS